MSANRLFGYGQIDYDDHLQLFVGPNSTMCELHCVQLLKTL